MCKLSKESNVIKLYLKKQIQCKITFCEENNKYYASRNLPVIFKCNPVYHCERLNEYIGKNIEEKICSQIMKFYMYLFDHKKIE